MKDALQKLFRPDQSRNEILQLGGSFTVKELREYGLGPETRGIDGNLGRDMLYVNDEVPVRLIPRSLLQLVGEAWGETHDIKRVVDSLYTSFYVFRECVNTDLEVPLVRKVDGIWEWPEPDGFAWGDEQTKTLAFLL